MTKNKTEKIASLKEQILQLENQRKSLLQQQKEQERKDRTKRLCRRAGLLESLLPEEQFKTLLEKTILTNQSRRILDGLTAQNAACTAKPAQTAQSEDTGESKNEGGVVHTEILLPENALAEFADRTVLWNAVEKIEKAKNALLVREIEIALPVELTREQNISLVREYVKEHFVAAGMCAIFAYMTKTAATLTSIS